MLAKWREGYQVVYAKRESRQHESAFKRGLAYSFYRVLTRVSDVRIPGRITGAIYLPSWKIRVIARSP
jgi:dolichol-phosphate mannosyltransferase